jgi:ATP-dependent exoDNAse (exonuclease V) alpha subunit
VTKNRIVNAKLDTLIRVHSIQGETAEHNLYINMDNYFDSRILYTAISRAKTLDQIYLVKN